MSEEALAPATEPAEVAPQAETQVDPAPEAPASETPAADETEEQRKQRESEAARVLQEKRERNRIAAEKRVEQKAWQKIAETLAAQLAQGKAAPQAEAPKVDAAPKRDDFTDWDDYQRALARYEARQELRQELDRQREEASRAAQEQEFRRVDAEHGMRNREFAKQVPDFVDVTDRDDIIVPGPASEAIKRLPNSSAVIYTIGHNPEIAYRLQQMPPMEQTLVVGQLSAWLASQTPRLSNAAPAGKTVGAKPSPSDDLPEDTDAYMKAANKKFR